MLQVMLVSLLLGLAPTVVAGDSAAADRDDCNVEGDYSVIDLLDQNVPAAVKVRHLETVKRFALDPHCTYERYLLGLLQRHGPDLPGNPAAKDVAIARSLIEAYALEGNLQGFADLAEMALEQKQAREAMQWTQVYLYLAARARDIPEAFRRSGYNADLLQRAQLAWRKARLPSGQEEISSVFNAYLQPRKVQLDALFLERQEEIVRPGDQGQGSDEVRVKSKKSVIRSFNGPSQPGYAIFLLEIQPTGDVSRIVAETFAPLPAHARSLRPMVEGITFHPFTGTEPQVVRIPAQYGYDGPVKIKK